jgi:hypothetical protein
LIKDSFEQLLARLFAARPTFKPATVAQYATVLRQFNEHIGKRHPRRIGERELRSYVLGLRSAWSRRRTISALRVLYDVMGLANRTEVLVTIGCSRPSMGDAAVIAHRLARAGWTRRSLAALSWSDVRNTLFRQGESDRRLDAHSRAQLRHLLCLRYPRSDRLLGDGPERDRVFRTVDLDRIE